ncbi:MAG: hypothetical protein HY863_15815 [Chloroflexi bacterium]|nr:hypothetical protein [Chloroflexota bacterium]
MKRLSLILATAIFMMWLLLPVPLRHEKGLFNKISGVIWCTSETSCLHEIGHALDWRAGWISHSAEFGGAVQVYVMAEFESRHPSDLAAQIVLMPGALVWSGYARDAQAEIYASIFEISEGQEEKMPEIFHKFYDWQRAQVMIEKMRR